MLPARFALLARAFDAHRLDAIALVPGSNFRRLCDQDFCQNERPLAVFVFADGRVASVVPNLELGSFGAEGLSFHPIVAAAENPARDIRVVG